MDIFAVVREYKIPLVLAAGSVFFIVFSLVLLVKSIQTTTPIRFSEDAATTSSTLGAMTVAVDVEGAVIRPGLYTLSAGSRVEDAIVAAGGLSTDADLAALAKTINRAAKVVDGGKVYIPDKSDPQSQGSGIDSGLQNGLISVNASSQSELEGLPGVGPVTAKKIIDNRPYQTLEELVGKKAVGTALFEKIKAQLTL